MIRRTGGAKCQQSSATLSYWLIFSTQPFWNSLQSEWIGLIVLGALRHKRGPRHVDFAACDVGCCTTNNDRGHHVVALTRLRFDFASAPHRDALLDRKAIGRPAKIGLRCHCPDEGGTSG